MPEKNHNELYKNYGYYHCLELTKLQAEVIFLLERFAYHRNHENNEYCVVLSNGCSIDSRIDEAYSKECTYNSWELTPSVLDDYVQGNRDIHRVIGNFTKFCAFRISSDEQQRSMQAAKHLYRFLRKEFELPSNKMIVYEDGQNGYLLLILFQNAVQITRLKEFQDCVVNCNSEHARDLGALIEAETNYRQAVPMPLGINAVTKERRRLVSANTFRPIEKLQSYAATHIKLDADEVEDMLALDFKAIEKRHSRRKTQHDIEPQFTNYPRHVTLSRQEVTCIQRQPKKSMRLLLLIILVCLKATPKQSKAEGVTIGMRALSQLSGLSISTVKPIINEMCTSGVLDTTTATVNSVVVEAKAKGPCASTYILGANTIISTENIAPNYSGYTIDMEAALQSVNQLYSSYFVTLYEKLMTLTD